MTHYNSWQRLHFDIAATRQYTIYIIVIFRAANIILFQTFLFKIFLVSKL